MSADADAALNKSAEVAPEISNVSCFVENGDTLLFAFNYGDDEGYTIVGASAGSFPVLAQSDHGSVNFDDVDKDGSFAFFINLMAESVINASADPDTAYASLWKEVGNDEWEYSVEVVDPQLDADTISGNKSRSRTSSGKASIYPYTGLALKDWCQAGDYNASADKGACIGCPAMAVGMLLYDVNNRVDGINAATVPYFTYNEQYPAYAKSVSAKLRKIADAIPNYFWRIDGRKSSGVYNPSDLLQGVKNLGFAKAELSSFNFEKAYAAMCIDGTDYFGNKAVFHRGLVMLGTSVSGGHVWFCDGYYEQQYQVTRRKKRLFHSTKVTKWMEYENRLFMNWGQEKTPDGWYIVENGNGMSSPYSDRLQMLTGLWFYTSK